MEKRVHTFDARTAFPMLVKPGEKVRGLRPVLLRDPPHAEVLEMVWHSGTRGHYFRKRTRSGAFCRSTAGDGFWVPFAQGRAFDHEGLTTMAERGWVGVVTSADESWLREETAHATARLTVLLLARKLIEDESRYLRDDQKPFQDAVDAEGFSCLAYQERAVRFSPEGAIYREGRRHATDVIAVSAACTWREANGLERHTRRPLLVDMPHWEALGLRPRDHLGARRARVPRSEGNPPPAHRREPGAVNDHRPKNGVTRPLPVIDPATKRLLILAVRTWGPHCERGPRQCPQLDTVEDGHCRAFDKQLAADDGRGYPFVRVPACLDADQTLAARHL